MTIGPLNADWLWKLAAVTVPSEPRHSQAESFRDLVRIESHEDHPILIATDGRIMSVILDRSAPAVLMDGPISLVIRGKLRTALQKAGPEGRKSQTVEITDFADGGGVHERAVTVKGKQPLKLVGFDADYVLRDGDGFPSWRKAAPTPHLIEDSFQALQAEDARVCPVQMELLRKVPVFGFGGVVVQPVLKDGKSGYDLDNVHVHIVREAGMSGHAYTLIAPMQHSAALCETLPDWACDPDADRIEERLKGDSESDG